MSVENETIADIICKKRERAKEIRANLSCVPVRRDDQIAEAEELEQNADRIEAAAERDHALLDANIARVRELEGMLGDAANSMLSTAIKQKQIGNAAAIRAALEEINRLVWDKRRHTKEETEAHRLATEALTSPPRNCDVYSHDEALIVWAAEDENEQNGCFDEWLYHNATEQKGDTDGSK